LAFGVLGAPLNLDLEKENVKPSADLVQGDEDVVRLRVNLGLLAFRRQPLGDQRDHNCNANEDEGKQHHTPNLRLYLF
jgi:hypothetical protein